jgi:LL-diaminopimelate aminotransferase
MTTPTVRPAERMQHLVPHFFASLSLKISQMQSAGLDVIRLDEGSPDLPPSEPVISALTRSASDPTHHSYQPHRGPQALRQAWVKMYSRNWGVNLDADTQVVPLLGSKEGIFHILLALVQPGDVVLVPDPGYVTYTRGALFAGAEPVSFRLLPERGYLPDLASIPSRVLARARMIWLNYPNNPTAAVATDEFFEEAVAFASKYGLLLCHDAAYNQVTFNGEHAPSLLQASGACEVAVEFNTLSKSHNMAGWRVGAALGSPAALRLLFTLKTNADSSHFLPVLDAAVEAMTGDQSWLVERNAIYRRRAELLVAGLRSLGLSVQMPQASLYVWCPLPAGWSSAVDFATAALENARVSLTPGTLFGQGGEGFLRISITAPEEKIAEAVRRLADWMA